MTGWLESLKGMENRVANLLPAKWTAAIKDLAASKKGARRVAQGAMAMTAIPGVGPLAQLVGVGRSLQKLGVVDKTGAGLAKGTAIATAAAMAGGAAVAAPVISGGAAALGRKALAVMNRPGVATGVKRAVAREVGGEVRRRVRAQLPPVRRRRRSGAPVTPRKPRRKSTRTRAKSTRARRPPSPKQIAARQRFAEMSRARARARKG